ARGVHRREARAERAGQRLPERRRAGAVVPVRHRLGRPDRGRLAQRPRRLLTAAEWGPPVPPPGAPPGQTAGGRVMQRAPGPTCAVMIDVTGTARASLILGTLRRNDSSTRGTRASSTPVCSTATSTGRPPDSVTARSTILRSARSVPTVRSSGATS